MCCDDIEVVDVWVDDEFDECVFDEVLFIGEVVVFDLWFIGFVLSVVGVVIDFVVYLGGLMIVFIFVLIVFDG